MGPGSGWRATRAPCAALDGEVTDIIDVTREVGDEEALKAQLRTALAEAQHAAAVKAQFLANMSHEIRAPR